ncbi:MAG: hypothetical protein KA116_02770 [Proteobacteria bacterium]|nr:hypothetical protein [Pseudomonadota bacterium]
MDSSNEAGSLVPKNASIETYKLTPIKGTNLKSYTELRSNFNPERTISSGNFHLSEMVSNQLSMEDDELRRFNEKVKKEVDTIIGSVQSEAEKKGYEDGLKAGTEKAYTEEKEKILKNTELVTDFVSRIDQAILGLSSKYEVELIEVAFKIAEIVIASEIEKNPTILSGTISEILERISKDDDATIKVPKHLVEIIPSIKEVVQSRTARAGRIHFEVDAKLPHGAIVVECVNGEISALISEKVNLLKKEVLKRQAEKT